jgi:hypothetical protein
VKQTAQLAGGHRLAAPVARKNPPTPKKRHWQPLRGRTRLLLSTPPLLSSQLGLPVRGRFLAGTQARSPNKQRRRRWTSMSRNSPSWSMARHRYIRLPAIRTTISSRCQRSLGRGRRWRRRRADRGTELQHPAPHRFVGRVQTAIAAKVWLAGSQSQFQNNRPSYGGPRVHVPRSNPAASGSTPSA